MGLAAARYQAIDPMATGPEAVPVAFENQVAYCRDNGAPVTASVCQAVGELLGGERGGQTLARVRSWQGAPLADALPLRIAGGLHALHLSGTASMLASIYEGTDPAAARERVADAIEKHDAVLQPWLDGPPQTNEAGRSWAFAAAMLWLAERGCPREVALFELGSSAGINLMMDRYRFDLGGVTLGPVEPVLNLAPEWRGPPPPAGPIAIASTRGCDVAPLDLRDPAAALRLRAYIWPEQHDRMNRLDAAITAARHSPPAIEQASAGEFVARILALPSQPGMTRMIAHSVVWQYIPAAERAAITAAIETAGAAARPYAPLAWVMLEANRDTHRHELMVRCWPGGGEPVRLATAHPHGAWVEWAG